MFKLLELGYTIRPDSDLYVLCGHVVSISAWRRSQPASSPVILQDASKPSSLQASKPSANIATPDQPQESQQQPQQKTRQQ